VVEPTMDPVAWLRKHLEEANTDLLREMVRTFVEQLMGAEANALVRGRLRRAVCGADHRRNGYRLRDFDTRAGTISLEIPKLRQGSYFPDWLLECRRRAERGPRPGGGGVLSRGSPPAGVDGLVKTLGIDGISKSQVSELAKSLDEHVKAFRIRPLDTGPYTYPGWMPWPSSAGREGAYSRWPRW
jgi:putative transposase